MLPLRGRVRSGPHAFSGRGQEGRPWGGEVLRNIVTIRVRQVGDKGLAILILARGLLGFVSLEKP